ncbi:phosphotransferase enzyme family protein [Nocardioides bruguierae]|uniref:phosphotransferase enzyme family protein n=1 Tax=Nocardioides bruguierae TaxID=2945102 RepID=UPI00201FC0F5|nr:phosphotransferase [Nocardioides bruguierae]MCL8026107.1 phosphotransferase [Nocardioides bruguierae]
MPLDPLAVFETLGRGAAAPAWLTAEVGRTWLPGALDLDVRLLAVSENATFAVRVAGEPRMVVRLQRPGYLGHLDEVRSELWWAEAIARETTVATPAPVRGDDGGLAQVLVDDAGTRWTAVAFAFVPGSMLEDVADPVPWFPAIGAVVAELHAHARDWDRPERFRRFSWDLPDLVGPDARWGSWRAATLDDGGRAVLEKAEAAALDVVGALPRDARWWGLVHGDLRPSNLMVDTTAAPGADALVVIDLDDCGFGFWMHDFGAALSFYEHRPEAPAMAAGWLAGYRSVAPLTAADLDVAAAMSVLRRLTLLGWVVTHREDALPPDLHAEMTPGTVDVCARYLADPRWLVEGA